MADRKRKGKAVSSSSQVPRFKTMYLEAHFHSKLSARKVLPELIIQVDESILDPCGFQIQQRKWERFTKPIQAVGHLMRAVLIHSIIIGENINVEEIIADQIYKFVYKTDVSSSLPFPSIIAALCADAKIPAIPDDTLISQEPPIIGVAMTRTRETRARNPRQQDKQPLLNNNHLKGNHNPNSTINKISLQTSTPTLVPPCPQSIGGLTNNKKRIGRALRPSTQEWTAWMIN
ncbi:hypothetical protein PIB30_076059 [Stylosanthes scabra]|uniref:Transposase n=1 Tax=Stylosanthes scabra TaxID=79078 RepID=A0ABU6TPQ8_9FABA|nr:hypothetical protein [Stylosanthes scabra]